MTDPGAGKYWNKHNKGDAPDKGKPFKHTRARGRLMLAELLKQNDDGVLGNVILEWIEKDPGSALDALIKASGEE